MLVIVLAVPCLGPGVTLSSPERQMSSMCLNSCWWCSLGSKVGSSEAMINVTLVPYPLSSFTHAFDSISLEFRSRVVELFQTGCVMHYKQLFIRFAVSTKARNGL